MPNRINKRKQALEAVIKQSVFEAVERILQTHSPGKLTVNMVAHEAGIATGTLYRYFKNKADLIAYIVVKMLEPFEADAEKITNSNMPVTEKLRAYIIRNMRVNDNQRGLFVLLFSGSSASSLNSIKEVEDARERSSERLKKIMREGISQGIFRNVPATNLVLSFAGIFQAFSGYRLMQQLCHPVEKDIANIMAMFMKGAESQKQ